MNPRSIAENEEYVDPFCEPLALEQTKALEQSDFNVNNNNFLFTEEENSILAYILREGDALRETPIINNENNVSRGTFEIQDVYANETSIERTSDVVSDSPAETPVACYVPLETPIAYDALVDIDVVLSQLEKNKRHVVEVKSSTNNYDDIKKLQKSFHTLPRWHQFNLEYLLYTEENKKYKLINAVFIPVFPNVCNALQLASKIQNNHNIRTENISFYEVSGDEVVTRLDDHFLKNHKQYTYEEVENEAKFGCYNSLIIQLNCNANMMNKLSSTLGQILEKFKDLKYTVIHSNNDYLAAITAVDNSIPMSLNTLRSLKMINDELKRVVCENDLHISVTLSKRTLKNNVKYANRANNVNVSTPATKSRRKKQRTSESASQTAYNNINLSHLINSFFHNPNVPESMKNQDQQIQEELRK